MSQIERTCPKKDVSQTFCQTKTAMSERISSNNPATSALNNNSSDNNGYSHEPSDGNSTTSMPSSVSPNFILSERKASFPLRNVNPTASELYSCQTCGRKFRMKARLLIHQKRHRGCPHSCGRCGLQFASFANLIKHKSLRLCPSSSCLDYSLHQNNSAKSFTSTYVTRDLRNRCLPDLPLKDFSRLLVPVKCRLCKRLLSLPNIYSYQIHLKVFHRSHSKGSNHPLWDTQKTPLALNSNDNNEFHDDDANLYSDNKQTTSEMDQDDNNDIQSRDSIACRQDVTTSTTNPETIGLLEESSGTNEMGQYSAEDIYDTNIILNKAIDSLLPNCCYVSSTSQPDTTTSNEVITRSPTTACMDYQSANDGQEKHDNLDARVCSVLDDDEGYLTSNNLDNSTNSISGTNSSSLVVQCPSATQSNSILPLIHVSTEKSLSPLQTESNAGQSNQLNNCTLTPVKTPQGEDFDKEKSDNTSDHQHHPHDQGSEETFLYLSTNEDGDPQIVEGTHWQANSSSTSATENHPDQPSKKMNTDDDSIRNRQDDEDDVKDIKNEESGDLSTAPSSSTGQRTVDKPKLKPSLNGAKKKQKINKNMINTMVKIDENGEILSTIPLTDGIDVSGAVIMANGGSNTPIDRKGRPCSFPCPACPRRFAFQCRLAAHLRCHTNIRPFMCHECGRAFTQKGYLARHAAVHRIDRPFMCKICNRSYKHYGSLVNHRRTHARAGGAGESDQASTTSNSNFPNDSNSIVQENTTKAVLLNGQTVILSHSGELTATTAAASSNSIKPMQHSTPKSNRGKGSRGNSSNSVSAAATTIFAQHPHQQQLIAAQHQPQQILLSSGVPQTPTALLNNSNMIIGQVDANQFQLTARAIQAASTANQLKQPMPTAQQQILQQQQQQQQNGVAVASAANLLANLNGQIYVTPEGLVYSGNAVNFQTIGSNVGKPMILHHPQVAPQQQHQQTFLTSSGQQIQQIVPINKIEEVLTAVQLDQQTFGQAQQISPHQAGVQSGPSSTIHLYSTQSAHQSSSDRLANSAVANNALAAIGLASHQQHATLQNNSISQQQQQQQQQHHQSQQSQQNSVLVSTASHHGHQHQPNSQQPQPTIITLGQLHAAFNSNTGNPQQHQQLATITSQANQQLHAQQHLISGGHATAQGSIHSLGGHQWSTAFPTNETTPSETSSGDPNSTVNGQQPGSNQHLIHTSDGQTTMVTCLPVTFSTSTNGNDPLGGNITPDQLQQHMLQQHHHQQQQPEPVSHQLQHQQNQVFHFLQSGTNGTQSIVTLPGYYLPTLATANLNSSTTSGTNPSNDGQQNQPNNSSGNATSN